MQHMTIGTLERVVQEHESKRSKSVEKLGEFPADESRNKDQQLRRVPRQSLKRATGLNPEKVR